MSEQSFSRAFMERATWDESDIVLEDDLLAPVTAAAEVHTGAMIALIPSESDLDRLVLEDGEVREELHLTLLFLGESADIDDDACAEIVSRVTSLISVLAADSSVDIPLKVDGFAASMFNPTGEEPCWVLGVSGEALSMWRGQVSESIHELADWPEQHEPFIPHVTLQYTDDLAVGKQVVERTGPITFDRIRVVFGDEITDIPLEKSSETASAKLDDNVTTEESAVDTQTVAEISATVFQDDECPPGQHKMPDGSCMPDEAMETQRAYWEGVAVIEDEKTGDGRMFAPGSLIWPDLNESIVAFQWQKETTHGGIDDVVVNVGRVTELTRDGNSIRARGTWDLGSEDGAEAYRRVDEGTLGGVSIVADDPEAAEVEYVFPEGCGDDAGKIDPDEPIEIDAGCFFPEYVIFHSGRIRALTLVDTAAFIDAMVKNEEMVASLAATGSVHIVASLEEVQLGAVGSHETGTTDDPWDASANAKRLPSPMSVDKARDAHAWIDMDKVEDGEITKAGCKFLHHSVGDGGSVGAANLTACSAIIGSLHGARGGTTIPSGDRRGVYNHAAKHLRDGGQEPPPFSTADEIEPLIAAAHLISIPDVPPASWYDEPMELPAIGAITVTDEGRVFGYLAPKNVAHRGKQERREVPMRNVDYSNYMTRATIVESGERVATGPITMDCGHASQVAWLGAEHSIEHYDNSCSVVATVRIGENDRGVWVAGALLPDVTPTQVARMLACQLSGDWRAHREKRGMRELCGALLVPVPGFPMATSRASVRYDHGELVASAVPVFWEAHDEMVRVYDEDTGGKPSKGTGRDKRLKRNKKAAETVPKNEDGDCPDGYHPIGDMCEPDEEAAADTAAAQQDEVTSEETLPPSPETDNTALESIVEEVSTADEDLPTWNEIQMRQQAERDAADPERELRSTREAKLQDLVAAVHGSDNGTGKED